MLELQVSQRRMLHCLGTIQRATRIVMGPPTTKFRADLFQILNQLLEPFIAGIRALAVRNSANMPRAICSQQERSRIVGLVKSRQTRLRAYGDDASDQQ